VVEIRFADFAAEDALIRAAGGGAGRGPLTLLAIVIVTVLATWVGVLGGVPQGVAAGLGLVGALSLLAFRFAVWPRLSLQRKWRRVLAGGPSPRRIEIEVDGSEVVLRGRYTERYPLRDLQRVQRSVDAITVHLGGRIIRLPHEGRVSGSLHRFADALERAGDTPTWRPAFRLTVRPMPPPWMLSLPFVNLGRPVELGIEDDMLWVLLDGASLGYPLHLVELRRRGGELRLWFPEVEFRLDPDKNVEGDLQRFVSKLSGPGA